MLSPRPVFLLVSLMLLSGCGGGSTDPDDGVTPINGTWRGGTSMDGFVLQTVLTLAERDSFITGTGFISGSGPECPVTVEGLKTASTIAFNLTCEGFRPIRFRGSQLNSVTIHGRVGGSNLPQLELRLLRQ